MLTLIDRVRLGCVPVVYRPTRGGTGSRRGRTPGRNPRSLPVRL